MPQRREPPAAGAATGVSATGSWPRRLAPPAPRSRSRPGPASRPGPPTGVASG